MGACKAFIELYSTKDVYTCGDILKGRVVVTQTKDISVNEIVIKLKGKAKVTIGEGEYRSVLVTTLYHNEVVVFPPPQLAEQRMSRLTLLKGTYEYPFEFTVPGHGEGNMSILLPTFAIDFNRIFVRYYIKATVRRSSRLAVNTRAELDIRTSPCVDRQVFDNYSLTTVTGSIALNSGFSNLKARLGDERVELNSLTVEFQYPRRGLRPSSHESMELGLSITRIGNFTQPVILTGVTVYLYRSGVYKTDVAEAKTRERVSIESLDLYHAISFDEEGVSNLSDLLSAVRLRAHCLPSFSSRLIDIQYDIAINISVTTERGKRKLELFGPTMILPLCIHQHSENPDYLPVYTHEDHPPEYVTDGNIPIYSR